MSIQRGSYLDNRIRARTQAMLAGAQAITAIRFAARPPDAGLAWASGFDLERDAVAKTREAFQAAIKWWKVSTGKLASHEQAG